MEFKLLEAVSGSDTHGMLPKGWYRCSNGRTYLAKGATPNNNQPFAEAMASVIAEQMNLFPFVRYYLIPSNLFPELQWNHSFVSVCERIPFNDGSLVSIQSYMNMTGQRDEDLVLNRVFSPQFLGALAAFDFLIGNIDRHLGNIALLMSPSCTSPSPVFDNGESFFYPYQNYSQINKYHDYLPNLSMSFDLSMFDAIVPQSLFRPAIESFKSRWEVLAWY